MDKKPINNKIFILVDYCISIICGASASLTVFLLIPNSWPMSAVMFSGMVTGMLVLPVILFIFGWLSAAFNIIMPGMFTAMLAGMLAGMLNTAYSDIRIICIISTGALVGIIIQTVFHIYDLFLHGEQNNQMTGDAQ